MSGSPLSQRTPSEVAALHALSVDGPLSFQDLVERGVLRDRGEAATVRRRLVGRGDVRAVGPVDAPVVRAAHCKTCRCPKSHRRRVAYEVVDRDP